MPRTLLTNNPSDNSQAFSVKMYVLDKGVSGGRSPEWVDFSDISNLRGKNCFKSITKVTNKVESGFANLVSSIQNITLNNEDGFFNRPFPNTLLTVKGNAAKFDLTVGYKRSTLQGCKCKIRVQMRIPENRLSDASKSTPIHTTEETGVGVFAIDEVIPDFKNRAVTVKLISLDGLLQSKDASGVRDGYDWYKYRPVSFLVRKIIESEFGSISPTDNISSAPFMPTSDGATVISILGRPPVFDGSTYRNDGLYTRAMCYAPAIGSAPARLYLGCDTQLWAYDSTSGVYTAIDTTTIPSGHYIGYIYHNSTDAKLYVVAWQSERWGNRATGQARVGWVYKLYYYNGSGNLVEITSGTNYLTSLAGTIRPADRYAYTHQVVGVDKIAFAYFIGRNQANSVVYGSENMRIPFSQDIQTLDHRLSNTGLFDIGFSEDTGDLLMTNINALSDDVIGTPFNNTERYTHFDRGWVYIKSDITSGSDETDTLGCPSIYHLGKRPAMAISPVAISGTRYFYYCRFVMVSSVNAVSSVEAGTSTQKWFEVVLAPLSGTFTPIVVTMPSTFAQCVPTCIKYDPGYQRIMVFSINYPMGTSGEAVARVHGIESNTTSPTVSAYAMFSGESGDNLCWSVLDVEYYHNSPSKAVVCFHNRKTGKFVLAWGYASDIRSTAVFSNFTKLRIADQPFMSLTYDSVDDCIYAYSMSESVVYKVSGAGACSSLNTTPVLSDEYGLLSNLTSNPGHPSGKPDVYGITSPSAQLEVNYQNAPGNYLLFRASQYVSDIIAYADFSDMDKMKVLTSLAEAKDSFAFFNKEGDFNFLSRVYTAGSPTYTIGGINGDCNPNSVEVSYGSDYVFNLARAVSYEQSFTSPASDALTLLNRTDKNGKALNINNVPFVGYTIEQRDTSKKIIRAFCTKGGNTTDGVSRWKYSLLSVSMEATLSTAYFTSGSNVTVNLVSVYGGTAVDDGVHVGDFITVSDPKTGIEITRGITAVTNSTSVITVSSDFGVDLKVNTLVTISRGMKTSSGWSSASWSDDGVTYITASASVNDLSITVDSAKNLSVGTVVRVGMDVNEYRINAISGLVVTLEKLDGTITNVIQVAMTSGAVVYAWYSPKTSDGNEIGGSKVFIKWLAGTGTAGSSYNKEFIVGDRLVIDCPGMKLAVQKNSQQLYIDGASVTMNGKKEYNIDNRFMDRTLAGEMVKRVVLKRANPKFLFTVTIPLSPYMDIVTDRSLTVIELEDSEALQNSNGFKEKCTILEVSHDLSKSNASTTFLLESINPI